MALDPRQLGTDHLMHGLFTQPNRRRDTHTPIRRIDGEVDVLDPLAHNFNDQVVYGDLMLSQCQYSSMLQRCQERKEYKANFSMRNSPGGGILMYENLQSRIIVVGIVERWEAFPQYHDDRAVGSTLARLKTNIESHRSSPAATRADRMLREA